MQNCALVQQRATKQATTAQLSLPKQGSYLQPHVLATAGNDENGVILPIHRLSQVLVAARPPPRAKEAALILVELMWTRRLAGDGITFGGELVAEGLEVHMFGQARALEDGAPAVLQSAYARVLAKLPRLGIDKP